MRLVHAVALGLLGGVLAFAGVLAPSAIAQDAESAAWAKVKSCTDLYLYVQTYPQGRHRQEADARIAALCGVQGAAPVFPQDPAGGSAPLASSPGYEPQFRAPESNVIAGGAAPDDAQRAMRAEAERRAQMEAQQLAMMRAQQEQAQAQQQRQRQPAPGAPPGIVSGGPPRPPPPMPSAAPTIASTAPGVALPSGYEIVSHVLSPTESYLPKRDGMPTGIVLLDEREKSRNQSLCRALLGAQTATVRTDTAARRANPRGDFLVTHWPVTGPVANQGDCGELLAKYDFVRAKRVKNAYALGGSRGPLFLALDPTGQIVFLDLNDASADDVFKATSDWMRLALVSPQNRPAAEQRLGLVAETNRLFVDLASGFASLVGVGGPPPLVVKFNDPVAGATRQFNIYRAGVYLIGATFTL